MPNQSTDYLPYLFIAAMIIISGVVAFVADGMGRKIGKKRLSFLGLRPRHTATLITVSAGILTSILTIGAIYLLSADVRDWIREGRSAIRRANEYRADADKQEKENERLEATQKNLQGTTKKLTSDVKNLTSQAKASKDAAALANEQLKAAQGQYSAAQQKVARLEPKLRSTEQQIQEKIKEIADKNRRVGEVRANLTKVEANLKNVSGQNNEYSIRNRDLEREQLKLEKELAEAERSLNDLQTQKKSFEAEIDSYKESIEAYRFSIEQYTTKVSGLQQQYEQISSQLRTNLVASRTKPMIYEASEELARIQLPPSLSPVAARAAFFDLLQRARTDALANKAINSPTTAPAGLFAREFNQRVVSVQDQEEAIVRGITAQRPELVFIARSVVNAFEGEFVLLEFVAYRNKLVYQEGKLIVEKRIDGRKSEVEVLKQIQDFISTNVRNQALKDGMIPPSGHKGQLGAISEEDLFDLIREVRSNNQLVRLQALAKADTNAGDQLDLLFRVRL